MKILVLNGGSSSLQVLVSGCARNGPTLDRARDGAGRLPEKARRSFDFGPPAFESLWQGETKAIDSPSEIDVVGHRIVHGGPKYRESVFVTPEVRAAIAEQAEFAPAHNRLQLAAIETVDRVVGTEVPQVAVFDTGFHATLAPAAYVYPGPYEWLEQGIRRYGFHGISVQYSTRRAAELLQVATEFVAAHRLPSRKWRVRDGGRERQERGHQHGIHAAGRHHDGHALGLHRSQHSGLPDPPARLHAPIRSMKS